MKEKLHSIKRFEKVKKENKGITLIALIITVIVMLILAGVTLSAITGTEGIFSKTESAKNKYIHSSVYEALQVFETNYQYDKYSGKTDKSLIGALVESEIIKQSTKNDKEYIINVEKLSGRKMSLGNGTDEETDVYKLVPSNLLAKVGALSIANLSLNSTTTEYNVVYCGKAGEAPVILGSLYDSNTEKLEPNDYYNYTTNEDDEIEILGFNFDKLNRIDDYFVTNGRESATYKDYGRIDMGEKLIIPAEINGKTVTKVSFNNNILAGNNVTVSNYDSNRIVMTSIKEIVFPSSVKIIDNITSRIWFLNLKKVILPENLEIIGEKAFYSASYEGTANLDIDMEIPNTVKKIESEAFYCTSINGGEAITLPTSLEEIYSGLRNKINGISNTKLKIIGAYVFKDCTFDKDLHLPETLIKIGEGAFQYCGDLGNVYVPRSVRSIDSSAFSTYSSKNHNGTQYTKIYIEGKDSADDFDSLGDGWCDTSKVEYLGKE